MRVPRAAVHCAIWALLASCAGAFIVPEELVSFLSIVYSNIPPIRKGTDSRVGLGFRLGPHADAQIVLELGPQTNTRPLQAGGPNFGSSSSKRHVALQPLDNDALLEDGVVAAPPPPAVSAAAGNWLTAWRTSVAAKAARRPAALAANDIGKQDDAAAAAPDPTKLSGAPLVSHLRKLYRKDAGPLPVHQQQQQQQQPARPAKPSKRAKASSKAKISASTTTTRRPSAAPELLSDVALD